MSRSLLRSILHRSARSLGVEIRRVPGQRPRRDEIVEVAIGGHRIAMYAQSVLARIYRDDPSYSGELARLVRLAVRKYPDLAMIDVGANCGDTVAVAKMGADLPVLCVEGDDTAFALLERNLVQFRHVQARKALLGERRQDIFAQVEDEGTNMTIVPSNGRNARRITLTTLDDCMREVADPERFRLLKIDTEGFDCRVIRGALAFIRSARPIIYMEYNQLNMRRIGENGIDTLFQLRDLGYRHILYYDNRGRLVTATTLDRTDLIRDLHEYSDGEHGSIYYYDLCLFPEEDSDVAMELAALERARRLPVPTQ